MRAVPMLRTMMKKQGREHQWFADLLGLSKSHVSLVVSGKREIDPIRASMIAGALGVPLLFVFESTDGDVKAPHVVNDGRAA